MNYLDLRKKYRAFVYESYSWVVKNNNLEISFLFKCGEFEFTPKLILKNIDSNCAESLKDNVDNLIFNIGMVELLSYWKAFCSPKIVVDAGHLDEYQTKWWKKLLINGMGQYFYENKIDFRDDEFVEIQSIQKNTINNPVVINSNKILVPVGGGKDSSVTLEILKNNYSEVSAFLLNPSKASNETVKVAGVESIMIERVIDPRLTDLNSKGFLNGHTPFTALLSFTSLLVGIIGDYKYVVFSNEQSSNEDNVKYLENSINHQYSKSLEFENDFREYNQKYLSDINYFSFLRPIYDIQIAKIFSQFNNYYSVIRSCNVGQKTETWCGKCPKCLSTFILFYPFMKDDAIKIFGKNLLEDESLKPILKSLITDSEVKPFECVGTRHELRVAMGIEKDDELMKFWSIENNLPNEFKEILIKYI